MKTFLTANITTKTATEGATAWQPPTYTFGETLILALQFTQNLGGSTVTPVLDIRAVKAAIGDVDARPLAGRWALQVGAGAQTVDNTTAALGYQATAAEVAAAINAKSVIVSTHGTAVVTKDDDTWRIVFGTGAVQVTVKVVDNTLYPVSFGHVDAYAVDAVWRHELRLIQAPVAFSDVEDVVLADAPAVTALINGQSSGVLRWNEVQKLTISPNFTGTYRLKFLSQYTEQLTVADTTETIQAALIAAFGDSFVVTDGELGVAFIEFTGDFTESDQPLIEAEVVTVPIGDLTVPLALDKAELAVRLRREATVTLPLEIRLQVADADENLTWLVVLRQDVTLQRPVSWPDLALVPGIDWLRPPSPKSYSAFNRESVITGQQFYTEVVGDGVEDVFTIAHGLTTNFVFVWVREDVTPGAQLVEGTDYSVTVENADSVTVTALGTPPAAGEWLITIVSAQTVAAFAEGLIIDIDQVTGLQALLDAMQTTLDEFALLIPNVTPGGQTGGSTGGVAIALPKVERIYPGTWPEGTDLDDVKLRGKRLLAAVHDASVTSQAALPLPSASAANGSVYQNDTALALVLPGGNVPVGGYFTSDGLGLYGVTRAGSSQSYFPTPLERELWKIEVSPEMLRTGKTLTVLAQLSARTAGANTDMQAVLVVEWGNIESQSSPVGAAINLITDNGTGTHTLFRKLGNVEVGDFTSVFGTDVITLTAHGLTDGDVVTVSNAGGALPPPLAAETDYVVRDSTTDTFKLAMLTTATNFEDIDWQVATPLLSHRIILAPTLQPHDYGVKIKRTTTAITATRTLYGGELGVAVAPPEARFALRARLINLDTRNPVTAPRGLIYYSTGGTATI